MPRHRRERVPRHRAQWQAETAAPRVQLSAAVAATAPDLYTPGGSSAMAPDLPIRADPSATAPDLYMLADPGATALDLSTPAATAEPTSTLILPAFQRRMLQAAAPAGPVADDGSGRVAGAMHRLIVTPWFAAATGFVVAAGMWIYSPHAEFKIPAAAGGGVSCQLVDCIATPGRQKTPNSTALLPMTPSVKSAGKIPRNAPSRLKFGSKVLWQSQGRFGVVISVTGRRIPQSWRLTFVLPGDTVVAVYGASWRAVGSDGGTATWPPPASSWQTTSPQNVGDQRDSVTSQGPGDSFVVVATGPQLVPTHCAFNNGLICQFSSAPQSH